jgi:hypothetical protein
VSLTMVRREQGSRMRLEQRPRRHPPWWPLSLCRSVHWPLGNDIKETGLFRNITTNTIKHRLTVHICSPDYGVIGAGRSILVVESISLSFFLKHVVEHLAVSVFGCRLWSGIRLMMNGSNAPEGIFR